VQNGAALFWLASFASLVAGLGTGLGALPIFALRRMSQRWEVTLIGASAGVMLAATAFSLLVPAINLAAARGDVLGGGLTAGLGLLAGGGGFWVVHRYLPHEHFIKGREGADVLFVRRLWLFVLAITLHNFPEGLAVGAGFGAPDPGAGWALTVGIALQNMPEGFVVALALVALGYSALAGFAISLLTGLVEPVGGLIGAATAAYAQALLPATLGFAAGAMLFVVGGEMIPETHRHGFETRATFGLLVGFALMVVLSAGVG
jgi:zinc transporter, ZIP family